MASQEQLDQFVTALIEGRQETCRAIAEALLAGGAPLRAVYTELLRDGLYEVGRRWEAGRISVANEHIATATVEALLADLYPRVTAAAPSARGTVLVTCAADEYHQVGARIVADILELRGWATHFLGANRTPEELAAAVRHHRPDLLALSVSIASHLPAAVRAVEAARGAAPDLPVVVGGRAFEAGVPETLAGTPGVRHLPSLEALEAHLDGLERGR